MDRIALAVAGPFEIGWAVGLKCTAGFTRLVPATATLISLVLGMELFGVAVRALPLGAAYAAWTETGTAGALVLGAVLFAEQATAQQMTHVGLIIAGIAGVMMPGSA